MAHLSLTPCPVRHIQSGCQVNYLPKPTSEKLFQDQTSPLKFFYIACTPPPQIHSLFHETKSYGNLTHNIVKGDSDSAVRISFSDHNYR